MNFPFPRKSAYALFLVILLPVSSFASRSSSSLLWENMTAYPGPARHHPITFANETHGFLLTGSTVEEGVTSDFYLYDAAIDTWTDLSNTYSAFPGAARSFGYGVVLNIPYHSKAYIGLGAGETELLGDLWEFDMQTHAWRELASMPNGGRRHPAMNAVRKTNDGDREEDIVEQWEIHVGLGDDNSGNLNDWWIYDIATDTWEAATDLPAVARHHPFYFSLGAYSYAGFGHSGQGIERDWFRMENRTWIAEPNFESFDDEGALITAEARVAGTQFSIELNYDSQSLSSSLGFVLSGDGDDHKSMAEGEFHAFDRKKGQWHVLPPHPGRSRWAPGSFVMRGSPVVYFTSGLDRTSLELFNDVWRMDLSTLFSDQNESETPSPNPSPVKTPSTPSGTEPTSNTWMRSMSVPLVCCCLASALLV